MLFWTILSLTYNIERTFNYIWQVKKPRTLYRKMTDYFSILLLLPLLIVLSSGLTIFMSTMVKNMEDFVLLAPLMKFLVRLIPFILTWAMFTGLFVFMPNTKVKLKYAIIPGIIAGTAFQAFQYLYIGSQIWVSRYNAIYGSFAAIPMFLLWAQIHGESACMAQNFAMWHRIFATTVSAKKRQISAAVITTFCVSSSLSLICKRFETEEAPYTAETLSDEHKIPIRLTKKILYELQDMHMIYETAMDGDDESIGYLPSVDINRMNVAMLLNRLDIAGTEAFKIDKKRYSSSWEALANAREEYYKSTSKILLKDL